MSEKNQTPVSVYAIPGIPRMKPAEMVEQIAAIAGVKLEHIQRRYYRAHEVVRVRHAIAYYLRTAMALSLLEIGKILGGFNHSTILSAITGVQDRQSVDVEYAEWISSLDPRPISGPKTQAA